jgi:2,4-dienoyl-CoA reductase-like NADH-dependent reductase (Old Yellow Enzyme family)
VQYCTNEEYEVTINFDVLDTLDPTIRAGMDLVMLARMTNTDPKLLEKYKVTEPQTEEAEQRRSSSLKSSLLYASHESLHR